MNFTHLSKFCRTSILETIWLPVPNFISWNYAKLKLPIQSATLWAEKLKIMSAGLIQVGLVWAFKNIFLSLNYAEFWKAQTNPSWISRTDLLSIYAAACSKSCTLRRKRQLCIIPDEKNLEQEGKFFRRQHTSLSDSSWRIWICNQSYFCQNILWFLLSSKKF